MTRSTSTRTPSLLDETSATPSAQDIFTTAVPSWMSSIRQGEPARLADATSRRLRRSRARRDSVARFLRDGVGGLNATSAPSRPASATSSAARAASATASASTPAAPPRRRRARSPPIRRLRPRPRFQALPHVVDPLFHDPARSAEAARLAQRLLRLAHDAVAEDRAEMGRARAQTHPSASATRASRGADPDPSSSSRRPVRPPGGRCP